MELKVKRIFVLVLILSMALVQGCGGAQQPGPEGGQDTFSSGDMEYRRDLNMQCVRAVWVSYLDIAPMMSTDKQVFEKNIDTMLDNLAAISTTDIYFQVRAFSDSFCKSNVYPSAGETIYKMSDEFDYFEIVVERCHSRGVKVHAWINPYRLHSSDGAVYRAFVDKLIADDGDSVEATDAGRALNPASEAAQKLVEDGVREILDNYDVDGIHLDDYFYPTTDEGFDSTYYKKYLDGGGTQGLAEWRRGNVTALVKRLYTAVKAKSPDIEFGISPDASVDRNMEKHYLDVELMCTTPGYIDYICPQIYFGYENQSMPFLRTAARWSELCTSCRLVVGLGFYKVGTIDPYAGSGTGEWAGSSDIISRQYLDSLEITNCDGVAFYRYGSIFDPVESVAALVQTELDNLKRNI